MKKRARNVWCFGMKQNVDQDEQISEFEKNILHTIYMIDRNYTQEMQSECKTAKLALRYAIAVFKELRE
jgi:hypothetical protein